MKGKYYVVCIFIASIIVSCSKGQNHEFHLVGLELKTKLKQQALKIVEEYINSVNSERTTENKYKIFRLLVEQSDYEVSFRIYPIIYYSHLIKDPPSAYVSFEDNLVLINTGIEKITLHDPHFLEQVKKLVGGRLENDLTDDGKTLNPAFRHRTHNPPVWKVMMADSLTIDKEAQQPARVKFLNK